MISKPCRDISRFITSSCMSLFFFSPCVCVEIFTQNDWNNKGNISTLPLQLEKKEESFIPLPQSCENYFKGD